MQNERINPKNPAYPRYCTCNDQRGQIRGPNCDIGAFELNVGTRPGPVRRGSTTLQTSQILRLSSCLSLRVGTQYLDAPRRFRDAERPVCVPTETVGTRLKLTRFLETAGLSCKVFKHPLFLLLTPFSQAMSR
jgi:hypothetical protein